MGHGTFYTDTDSITHGVPYCWEFTVPVQTGQNIEKMGKS
jgi:hypothetical protein